MRTLLAFLLFLGVAAFTSAATNTFDGAWQWQFKMPDGTEGRPKLKLKQDGANLTGTSIVRGGTETHITNGVVNGDSVQFEVRRERNGILAITRYSGKRDGDIIRGKVES